MRRKWEGDSVLRVGVLTNHTLWIKSRGLSCKFLVWIGDGVATEGEFIVLHILSLIFETYLVLFLYHSSRCCRLPECANVPLGAGKRGCRVSISPTSGTFSSSRSRSFETLAWLSSADFSWFAGQGSFYSPRGCSSAFRTEPGGRNAD